LQEAGSAPKQRPPSDSYLSLTYPFTSNELLRDQVGRVHSSSTAPTALCSNRMWGDFSSTGCLYKHILSVAAFVAAPCELYRCCCNKR
jgi:hypothetical protein